MRRDQALMNSVLVVKRCKVPDKAQVRTMA